MNFLEFVGFVVTMLLFLVISARQAKEQQRRRQESSKDYLDEDEDEDEDGSGSRSGSRSGGEEDAFDEQDAAIREILESVGVRVEKSKSEKTSKPVSSVISTPLPPRSLPVSSSVAAAQPLPKYRPTPIPHLKSIPPPSQKKVVTGIPPKRDIVTPKLTPKVPMDSAYNQLKGDSKEEAYLASKEKTSRAHEIVKGKRTLREAMILREILGPPKGLS